MPKEPAVEDGPISRWAVLEARLDVGARIGKEQRETIVEGPKAQQQSSEDDTTRKPANGLLVASGSVDPACANICRRKSTVLRANSRNTLHTPAIPDQQPPPPNTPTTMPDYVLGGAFAPMIGMEVGGGRKYTGMKVN